MADDRSLSVFHQPLLPQPVPVPVPVPGDEVQEYLARLLVNAVLPQHRDRVLDVACDPGYVLMELANRVGSAGRIVGIAETREALAQVQRWQADARMRLIELYTMAVRHLEFPAGSFTLVTCGQALHRLPEPLTTLREIYRVLRPGGWVALTIPHPESGEALREAILQRLNGVPALPPGGAPLPRWDENHVAGLLTEAGFATVHVQVVRRTSRYSDATQWWQAGAEPAATPALLAPDAGFTQALQALQDPGGPPGFEIPLVVTVAVARRGEGSR